MLSIDYERNMITFAGEDLQEIPHEEGSLGIDGDMLRDWLIFFTFRKFVRINLYSRFRHVGLHRTDSTITIYCGTRGTLVLVNGFTKQKIATTNRTPILHLREDFTYDTEEVIKWLTSIVLKKDLDIGIA